MPRDNRKKFKRKVVNRIASFESAVRGHDMKGSEPPEEFDDIEKFYKISKSSLIKYIMETYDQLPAKD